MFSKIFIAISLFVSTLCFAQTQEKKISVALVLPTYHQALEEIKKGFQEALPKNYELEVFNGMGKPQGLMTIFQQIKSRNFDVVAPVGTSTSQMALQICRDQPVLSLASNLDQNLKHHKNLIAILDEIEAGKRLQVLRAIYPDMKKIMLIHSSDEKIFKEKDALLAEAPKLHFEIQTLLLQKTADLYRLSRSLHGVQGIFILKDHEVVSGVESLVKSAKELKIPLIASDEGSVKKGAPLAYGVEEAQIGRMGASMIEELLKGKTEKVFKSVEPKFLFIQESIDKKEEERLKKVLSSLNTQVVRVAASKN